VPLAQVLAQGQVLGLGQGPAQEPRVRLGLRVSLARVRLAVVVPAFFFTSPLFFHAILSRFLPPTTNRLE
jgi:hypothetical protein